MKVAIVKSRIYKGGVTQVLASIIQVLNEHDITPDLITLRCDINEEIVQKNYGQKIKFNIKKIASDIKMPYEWHFLYFNLVSRRSLKQYDLIIDSNNTSFLAQSKVSSINYTHYPRKDRVLSNLYSLHLPDGPNKKFLDIKNDPFWIARFLYSFNKKIKPREKVICNSNFTASKVKEVFPRLKEMPEVIYPPVELNIAKSAIDSKKDIVITLGRFSEEKRQLEQIEIAKQLPNLKFRILGFSGNGQYLKKCQELIASNNIQNVEIIPDPDFESIGKMMSEAKYFLHNVRNEPFGISTVQAIAHGCIPIVHNSGGSKEIVKKSELLFNDIENCIRSLNKLNSLSDDEKSNLISEIDLQFYSRDYFMAKIKHLLSDYLK